MNCTGCLMLLMCFGQFDELKLTPRQQAMLRYEIHVPQHAPADGPIPFLVVLRNVGTQPVRVVELVRPWFQFYLLAAPAGWQLRSPLTDQSLCGMIPLITLRPGERLQAKLYLHEFAADIQPGDAELTAAVNGFEQRFKMHVTPANPQRLAAHLKQVRLALQQPGDHDDHLESLVHLPSDEVIPLLQTALIQPTLASWHRVRFRQRIEEWMTQHPMAVARNAERSYP